MNLRLKTLLASSIATVVLVLGLSAGLSYLILQQIASIEVTTMNRRLDRSVQSLLKDLGVSTEADRSTDTSDDENSLEQAIENADVAIILDRNGNPVTQKLGDSALQEAQLPSPSLQTILTNLPAQWAGIPTAQPLNLPEGVRVGFLQTSEGLLLLTERPWLQRDDLRSVGDHRGSLRLLAGQWLRPDRLQTLGERTLLVMRLLPVSDPAVPAQLRDPQAATGQTVEDYSPKPEELYREAQPPRKSANLQAANQNRRDRQLSLTPRDKSERQVRSVTGKRLFPKGETSFLAGYLLLHDVRGEPVAVLQAISPKPFVRRGEEGVKTLLAFLWVTVLAFGIALNLLLDRWVLARISNLSRQLKLVKEDFSHATQVALTGQDELSYLAEDINAMLQRQERYQESLRLAKAEIEAANRELERLASTDGLTQVMNRRFFQIHLEEVWQEALQTSQPLSLLLCDVDFFKLYNDTYGHLAGDLCLQKVARAMSAVLEREPTGIVARYGGEEFAAVLTNTQVSKAIAVAEQMRMSVLNLNIPHASSKAADCVTLSIGICSLIPQPHLSPRDLIARADEHLYQAKAEGRNRVVAAKPASDRSAAEESQAGVR